MTAAPAGLVIEGVLTENGGFVQTNGSSFAGWLSEHEYQVAGAAIAWIEAELAMDDGNFRDVAEILAEARSRFTQASQDAGTP